MQPGLVRSLHKNGLLLPQPRLSKPVVLNRAASERKPHSEMGNPDMQRRWPHQHLSDSDGEEGVSEADRDARLA